MFLKINSSTWKLVAILLLLTGCLPGTPPDVEAAETITPTLALTETTIPTAASTEVSTPSATPAETSTPTSIPTETTKPTIAPTQGELVPLPDPLFAIAYIFKDTLRIK